ncbi:hypothetical protein [Pseudomonas sp.]|uniref:hypothetical protein n=1 Tax=Pseudomonas sp. TaxID=306 RepID=UPI00260699C7|nr:hypothetical protein [Pseudomonas sp.]
MDIFKVHREDGSVQFQLSDILYVLHKKIVVSTSYAPNGPNYSSVEHHTLDCVNPIVFVRGSPNLQGNLGFCDHTLTDVGNGKTQLTLKLSSVSTARVANYTLYVFVSVKDFKWATLPNVAPHFEVFNEDGVQILGSGSKVLNMVGISSAGANHLNNVGNPNFNMAYYGGGSFVEATGTITRWEIPKPPFGKEYAVQLPKLRNGAYASSGWSWSVTENLVVTATGAYILAHDDGNDSGSDPSIGEFVAMHGGRFNTAFPVVDVTGY